MFQSCCSGQCPSIGCGYFTHPGNGIYLEGIRFTECTVLFHNTLIYQLQHSSRYLPSLSSDLTYSLASSSDLAPSFSTTRRIASRTARGMLFEEPETNIQAPSESSCHILAASNSILCWTYVRGTPGGPSRDAASLYSRDPVAECVSQSVA
jgi:hypothetical protein